VGLSARAPKTAAVLFDRDGTLIADVPYNADPSRVMPKPGAQRALARLRRAGLRTGVVSNQRGVALGLISTSELAAVNRRVDELLGPFDVWCVCPHDVGAGCSCRKPRPGLIEQAAQALGVLPAQCAVVGDVGSDMDAAAAAGARSLLVPTGETCADEVARAPVVATNLAEAVELVLAEL
jgi:HAD superfamily hydrolase (TIGR01662 family)